jgi:catechol 2,3-dioxygenase-like lactoylglutathione lyase family enzyme
MCAGGIEVWLADHQVDDGLALPAEFVRAVGSGAAGGWLDPLNTGGDAGGGHVAFLVGDIDEVLQYEALAQQP